MILGLLGVRKESYSLAGGREDTVCMERVSPRRWETYYFERGEQCDVQVFRSEHDACIEIISRFVDHCSLEPMRGKMDNPLILTILDILAWYYWDTGQPKKGGAFFERLIEPTKKQHPDSWEPLWAQLGFRLCQTMLGESERSRVEESIQDLVDTLGEDHARVTKARQHQAELDERLGKQATGHR
jgi:hypothetical protein